MRDLGTYIESYNWHRKRFGRDPEAALECIEHYDPNALNVRRPVRFFLRLRTLLNDDDAEGEYRAALDALRRDPRGMQNPLGLVVRVICEQAARFKDTSLEDVAGALLDTFHPYMKVSREYDLDTYDRTLKEKLPEIAGWDDETLDDYLDTFKILCNLDRLDDVAKARQKRDLHAINSAEFEAAKREYQRRRITQRREFLEKLAQERASENDMIVPTNLSEIGRLVEDMYYRFAVRK